ncbi:MAG: 3-oxoacyl-ACP reductase FabG [Candidatus Kariarchaeaceae archaeon]|jgi:3-oxoacyl-[acyl-carrier protein] reductase
MKQFGYVDYISQSKVGDEFLTGLREGVLKGTRCTKCNEFYFPPRAYCTKNDLTDEFIKWEAISGDGTIVSFSEVHIAPVGFERFAPYIVCVVDMKEGGRMIGWADASLSDLQIGDPVRVEPELIAGNRIAYKILFGESLKETAKVEEDVEEEIQTRRLSGKIAIITGAGKGIGKEIAVEYAREGASVVVAARTYSDVESVAQQIQSEGGNAYPIACDISNVEDVENMVKTTVDKFGKLDILVNNAGISRSALIHRTTDEMWDQVVNINQKGTFNCIRAVIPHFMDKKPLGGKIINFTSTAAKHGNAGQVAYTTSKWGIVAMTKTAARELASYNVQVNCIMPGYIETPMTADTPAAYREQTISQIPLLRIGETKDISKMTILLGSQDSDYMTGTVVQIDGGLRM